MEGSSRHQEDLSDSKRHVLRKQVQETKEKTVIRPTRSVLEVRSRTRSQCKKKVRGRDRGNAPELEGRISQGEGDGLTPTRTSKNEELGGKRKKSKKSKKKRLPSRLD